MCLHCHPAHGFVTSSIAKWQLLPAFTHVSPARLSPLNLTAPPIPSFDFNLLDATSPCKSSPRPEKQVSGHCSRHTALYLYLPSTCLSGFLRITLSRSLHPGTTKLHHIIKEEHRGSPSSVLLEGDAVLLRVSAAGENRVA